MRVKLLSAGSGNSKHPMYSFRIALSKVLDG